MQFGPSLDKRKIQGLVSGTGWNEFIELTAWRLPMCCHATVKAGRSVSR